MVTNDMIKAAIFISSNILMLVFFNTPYPEGFALQSLKYLRIFSFCCCKVAFVGLYHGPFHVFSEKLP